MMRELLGSESASGGENLYEQLVMDVSTLEFDSSNAALDDGYKQIEMSVMNGQLNTQEMIKRQAGVSGDTIYMGSISVYPKAEADYMEVASYYQDNTAYGQPIYAHQNQQYYDATTGVMYMPMYPTHGGIFQMQQAPMYNNYIPPQMTAPIDYQSVVGQQMPTMTAPMGYQSVEAQQMPTMTAPMGYQSMEAQQTPTMTAPIEQQSTQDVVKKTVSQETTMYPATSITKMVDIFGEDKKYSKALMILQAESEYKVALHANAGKSGNRYMHNLAHMDKTKQLLNWNWGAFLFGPFWYAYRKMLLRGLFLMLFILYGLSTNYPLSFAMGIPLLVGAFSDKIYKNRLDYMIDRQFSMTAEARARNIEKRGGVSKIYVVVFILMMGVIAITTYIFILPEVELIKTTWDGLIRFAQNVLGLY